MNDDVTFELLLESMNVEAKYLRRHPHDAGAIEDVQRAAAAIISYVKSEQPAKLTSA